MGAESQAKRRRRPRIGPDGRAFAGSQLQVQVYVGANQDALSDAVLRVLPTELKGCRIDWRAPKAAARYQEPRDRAFLEALNLAQYSPQLAAFWPRSGPRWDALGVLLRANSSAGYLLVEGKSYPAEIRGNGCTAKAERSLDLIKRSLQRTRENLGISPEPDWLGELYQYANRLAHVHFVREITGQPAWLVNLCFTDDPRTPTSAEQWQDDWRAVKHQLGLLLRLAPTY